MCPGDPTSVAVAPEAARDARFRCHEVPLAEGPGPAEGCHGYACPVMRVIGFGIDPGQRLAPPDEARLARLAAELGYQSAWTPSYGDKTAFDTCLRWHHESGLATGIAVAPASAQPPSFYADQARRVWEGTGGTFTLGVGSGNMAHAAEGMRRYIEELRPLLPNGLRLYLAALGPLMLGLTGEVADGVALNWSSAEQVAWSRQEVERSARKAGRRPPRVHEYIRTCVDPDPARARSTLVAAAKTYMLGSPAYRRHFARMGLAEDQRRLEAGGEPTPAFFTSVGATGAPGTVRAQFERLAAGLDEAIVRILVTQPGDATSAERVLRECAPKPAATIPADA